MERTLRDGLAYLLLQDEKLSVVGSLLDDCLATLSRPRRSEPHKSSTEGRLAGEIIALSLEGLLKERHKGVPLFDDGRSSPLKFNVLEDGKRRTIVIPKGNLAQPALTALRISAGRASPGPKTLLEAIKEILQLRTRNHARAEILGASLESIEEKWLHARRNRSRLLGEEFHKPQAAPTRALAPPSRAEGLLASFRARAARIIGVFRPAVTPTPIT